MTSSLVGSEMCIRDSIVQHGATLEHNKVQEIEGTGGEDPRLVAGSQRTPVSYTHLTLPTICSV
eukprot:1296951-Prorocentrum_lima.AAC.1